MMLSSWVISHALSVANAPFFSGLDIAARGDGGLSHQSPRTGPGGERRRTEDSVCAAEGGDQRRLVVEIGADDL